MKPFVHQQKPSAGRWFAVFGAVGTAFAVWFFDLVPQLSPVPTGHLATPPNDDVPELTESWDAIVDQTGQAGSFASSDAGDEDPLLHAIVDDGEPLDRVLDELTEPDVFDDGTGAADTPGTGSAAGFGESRTAVVTPAGFESTAGNEGGAGDEGKAVVPAVAMAREDHSSPVVLSADTAGALRDVDRLLREDDVVEAHYLLSHLYWKHPEERAVFRQRLESTARQIFQDPHRHFSPACLVEPGDTLESIAKRYDVPWQYLARLNRIEPEELQAGQELKVIKGPFSAVIDLHRYELTVHAHGYYVRHYPIGTGRAESTPVGTFTVQNKLKNPTWYRPEGGQVDADDPANPLGEYWIGLGDHIGIHGTIDPDSIGTSRSRGCIHMRDADIAEVFEFLGIGSTVRIRP